jgi:hypothetical protein
MVENAQKIGTPGQKKEIKNDERYYQIIKNKDGNTSSVLRFVPPREEDDTFFIQEFSHSFEVDGRKLFTKCPTTIGLECPICDYNKENWKTYSEKQQMARKRKLKYVSNIYVVADPENPSREGKVFLWAYGISVHKKIMNMVAPKKDGPKPKKPFNIFDEKNGKDFELNVTTKDGYNNYDDSSFSEEPSALCDGDTEKLKEIEKSTYVLKELIPKKETFKTYDELKGWLESVLTGKKQNRVNSQVSGGFDNSPLEDVSSLDLKFEEPETTVKNNSKTEEPLFETTSDDEFFTL